MDGLATSFNSIIVHVSDGHCEQADVLTPKTRLYLITAA